MKRSLAFLFLAVPLLCPLPAHADTAYQILQQNRVLAPYDLSVIPEVLRSNANVIFVDSGHANRRDATDGIHGRSPSTPFATLDFAVGRSTAGQNNIIVLMPYHSETKSAKGVIADIDVSGITVLGLGYGPARPNFIFAHADANFIVGRAGDGATFKNLTFQPGANTVAQGIVHEDGADNITWIDCEWMEGVADANEFLTAYHVITDANDLAFTRCRWTSIAAAGATQAILADSGAVAGLTIGDCLFYGDWSTACISSNRALTRVLIKNSDFYNANSGEPLLELTGTANLGVARGNTFINDGTANDMGGVSLVGNLTKTAGDSNADAFTMDLVANNLDHFALTAVAAGTDLTAEVADGTVLSNILTTGGDTSNYARATMSLQAISVAAIAAQTAAEKIDTNTELRTLLTDSDTPVATQAQVNKIDAVTISTTPTAASLATFLASGGTSLGTQLPVSTSLYDVVKALYITAAGTGVYPSGVTDDSILAMILSKADPAAASSYSNTTDSLEAIADVGVSTASAVATVQLGQPVYIEKTAVAVTAGTVADVFTIAGGDIIVHYLAFTFTTAASADSVTMAFTWDPTAGAGTDTPICTGVDVVSAAIGDTVYTLGASAGAALKAAIGTLVPQLATNSGFVLGPGAIDVTMGSAGLSTGIGTVKMIYTKLSAGVTVAAP